MYMYFETPKDSNDKGSFRIRPLTITPVQTPQTKQIDGYDLINGEYISNNDLYGVVFNADSVTIPLILDNISVEKVIGTVTLSGKSDGSENILDNNGNMIPWQYHWDKTMLGEEPGRIYTYWIEETDENGQPFNPSDYVTVISGNHVATNTQDNPIVVSNTYIWYTLPATGGDGSLRFYLAAAVLISISLFSAIALIRRERRSG